MSVFSSHKPWKPNQLLRIFVRHRHLLPHRLIKVQLLETVDGLGSFGTVQSVLPGYMRNVLFPLRKARYLQKESPQLLTHSDQPIPGDSLDESLLIERLKSLSEIVLERNAKKETINPSTTRSLLYRPMTIQSLVEYLEKTHEIKGLHPPYASLSVENNGPGPNRLASTGEYTVMVSQHFGVRRGNTVNLKQVRLRSGEKVPLKIRIERTYTHKA